MVCAAANLDGTVTGYKLDTTPVTDEEAANSAKAYLPDYIRKAWGVPAPAHTAAVAPTPALAPLPPPPSVRLSGSLNAVKHVVASVIEARVAVGDAFVANLNRSRSCREGDLWNTASIVPMPRSAQHQHDQEYYRVQAIHGYNATQPNVFCDGSLPKIPLMEYVNRLFATSSVSSLSPPVYILMLIYLDRVMARCPGSFLHSYNVHRMLLGAFVTAAKYHEDEYILQSSFAKHGGVTSRELCDIERDFLKALDYRCFLTTESFESQELDIIQEGLEGPTASRLHLLLRAERVLGVDVALARIQTRGTRTQPPRALAAPVKRGDLFHGILIANDSEAAMFNLLLEQKATQQWMEHRQRLTDLWLEAHTRAIMEEINKSRSSWLREQQHGASTAFSTAGPGTWLLPNRESHQIGGGVGAASVAPPLLLEHSKVIAKSAVSFILNDNDPFADLNAIGSASAGRTHQSF